MMAVAVRSKVKRRHAGGRIGYAPWPLLVYGMPWASVAIASLTPLLPIITSAPLVPPLALLMLIAWRQLRPGLLPIWAGLPLGMWNDLFSGQPLGCAILLFSLTMIALELIEMRLLWRGFLQEWIIASTIAIAYLALGAVIANPADLGAVMVLGPQVLLTLLAYPIVNRLVGILDRIRVLKLRRIA
ncbi:rod shape-determining protein MreD [Pseudoblastomonas halimionae]|nr:rod shape-determining protein MreD [Alteriqipengyuania halimionae]